MSDRDYKVAELRRFVDSASRYRSVKRKTNGTLYLPLGVWGDDVRFLLTELDAITSLRDMAVRRADRAADVVDALKSQLAALHQEIDWMLNGVGGTDSLTISVAHLARWRNTLASVDRIPEHVFPKEPRRG